MYDQLIKLKDLIIEKAIRDQILKSINIMLQNNDLSSTLTIEEVDTQLENVIQIISQQSTDLNNMKD